jgi:hypothetical protein
MVTTLSNILKIENRNLHHQLLATPLLQSIQIGDFSEAFAKRLVAGQYGYNIRFILELARMRGQALDYPNLRSFIDRHLSTEFGSNLDFLELYQSGEPHICMIDSLASSLSMTNEERRDWGVSYQNFFDQALSLIGGANLAMAIGALYADEVFANVWLPVFQTAFKKYCDRTSKALDLEFFDSHANEIEPAHVEHASYLMEFCQIEGLNTRDFLDGYRIFHRHLTEKFNGLYLEMRQIDRLTLEPLHSI